MVKALLHSGRRQASRRGPPLGRTLAPSRLVRLARPKGAEACACGGACPRCRPNETGPILPRGAGVPLPDRVRETFAPRLGRDLRDVRIHPNDPRPSRVGAAAYTVGSDIVFGPGRYRPDTGPGRRVLAHELTHVAQQATASRASTVALGPADDSFERE